VRDNKEMSRIVAEKVMGWGRKHRPWTHDIDSWVTASGVFGCRVLEYSPPTNIAQAFEAAETWRKVDEDHREWGLSSPSGPSRGHVRHPMEWDALFTEGDCDWEGYSDSDPAFAITEALVKAVSDDG